MVCCSQRPPPAHHCGWVRLGSPLSPLPPPLRVGAPRLPSEPPLPPAPHSGEVLAADSALVCAPATGQQGLPLSEPGRAASSRIRAGARPGLPSAGLSLPLWPLSPSGSSAPGPAVAFHRPLRGPLTLVPAQGSTGSGGREDRLARLPRPSSAQPHRAFASGFTWLPPWPHSLPRPQFTAKYKAQPPSGTRCRGPRARPPRLRDSATPRLQFQALQPPNARERVGLLRPRDVCKCS